LKKMAAEDTKKRIAAFDALKAAQKEALRKYRF
jgi:hypothetical protein